MVRGFMLACAASLGMAGGAVAQTGSGLPSGMVMHRTLAGQPDATGASLAESTGGGFSVRMPLPFNDFALLERNGDVKRACTVGGKLPNGFTVQASRMVYVDTRKLADLLMRAKVAPPGAHLVGATDLTFNGWPAIDLEIRGKGRVTWMRWLVIGGDAMVLGVEGPSTLENTMRPLVQPFFASLKVDGACTGKAPS